MPCQPIRPPPRSSTQWGSLLLLALVACSDGASDADAAQADAAVDAATNTAVAGACPRLVVYRDEDGDDVGFGERLCADRVEEGFALSSGDCAPSDPTRFARYAVDRDGDGRGDPSASLCAGADAPEGFVAAAINAVDCDDGDAQRGPGFHERFDDGVDSSCDDVDDPTTRTEVCSCELRVNLTTLAEVGTACATGFDPADAAAALPALDFGAARTCEDRADLAIGLAVQCQSQCSNGPIYFAVANLGGQRSTAATVSAVGQFRAAPSRTPIAIEPLDPGKSSALIEVTATGSFSLILDAGASAQCDTTNDVLELIVADYHCGFTP